MDRAKVTGPQAQADGPVPAPWVQVEGFTERYREDLAAWADELDLQEVAGDPALPAASVFQFPAIRLDDLKQLLLSEDPRPREFVRAVLSVSESDVECIQGPGFEQSVMRAEKSASADRHLGLRPAQGKEIGRIPFNRRPGSKQATV